jgi:hypothetical protein
MVPGGSQTSKEGDPVAIQDEFCRLSPTHHLAVFSTFLVKYVTHAPSDALSVSGVSILWIVETGLEVECVKGKFIGETSSKSEIRGGLGKISDFGHTDVLHIANFFDVD